VARVLQVLNSGGNFNNNLLNGIGKKLKEYIERGGV
jgi:hypothetical protein